MRIVARAQETLYHHNVLDLRACGHLLQHCTDHRLIHQGKQIHAHIVLNSITPQNFLAAKLLNFYSKTNHLSDARKVFDEIPQRNIFSWNAMFIAYTLHNQHIETLKLFSSLLVSSSCNSKPDNFSITCVLKSLSSLLPDPNSARVIHGYVLRNGHECDIFVLNALVTFYARCGELAFARRLFDEMPERDTVSWNSMIAGYSQGGLFGECLELYKDMVGSADLMPNAVTMVSVLQACAQSNNLVFGTQVHRFIVENNIEVDAGVCNTIVGFYAKCGKLDYARELFGEMKERDEVSYNSMITGYMIHGFVDEAMELFREMETPTLNTWNAVLSGLVQNKCHEGILGLFLEMQAAGIRPNYMTISSVLPTFSYYSNLKGGKQIHCYAIRNNFNKNMYVATAMIDLYAKAGFLLGAHRIFSECRSNSVILWTAIISAYAAHGNADAALALFSEMLKCGVKPDPVTFTSVLSACAHAGVLDEARLIFETMLPVYGIHPSVEHYACMVGVLGRAGLLHEAAEFILKMPIEPSAKVWGALLNGVSLSGDVELGKFVCARLFEIEPENSWNYIIMANLYSQAGMWEEAEEVRQKLKNLGMKKTPGCSWIETKSRLLSFTAGAVSDDIMEETYAVLEILADIMRQESYATTFELDDESRELG